MPNDTQTIVRGNQVLEIPKPIPAPDVPARITRYPYLNRAVVVVNGFEFFEWESVSVRQTLMENPAYTCRLTTSEIEPWYHTLGGNVPRREAYFRIRPGDACAVILDGFLAITGLVATRQVYYSATQHTVEIQAESKTGKLSRASPAKDGMEFKDKPATDIIKEISEKLGVSAKVLGSFGGKNIPRFSVRHGDTAWDAIERVARMANMTLTTDVHGNLVVIGGAIAGGIAVVEGENILEGREYIHAMVSATGGDVSGQGPGGDQQWGAVRNLMHDALKSMAEFTPGNLPRRFVSELPSHTMDMLQSRSRIESNVDRMNEIYVTITTLGWQRHVTYGGLWTPGEYVHVKSPMLIMDQPLKLNAVTFSQDNRTGTRSTLELVNETAAHKGKAQA
jgi:prophage tail gpP-like protein